MPVRVRAYAKVNLLLAVGPRRADGYHEVLSLMQSVGLQDTLDLSLGPSEAPSISFRCTHPGIPHDRGNLVYRAIEAFREEFGVTDPVSLTLEKGIPVAAGLAGGSADAAATLAGLCHLYEFRPENGRLSALAARLGADVPFCLTGGTARAEGIGERLTSLPVHPSIWLVLWKPPHGVSTAEVYQRFDTLRRGTAGILTAGEAEARFQEAVRALSDGDLPALGRALANDLAQVTEALQPEVREARERFLAAGAPGALMSGSGPTVFALAGSEDEGLRLSEAVNSLPGEIHLTRMVGRGVQVDLGLRRPQKETRPLGPK